MRVLFISSCTGDKKYKPENQLTEEDFYSFGTSEFYEREKELDAFRAPAHEIYTGMQHVLLKRGLDSLRSCCTEDNFDVRIISAGYGVIKEDTQIPHEMTFQGMKVKEIDGWSAALEIPQNAYPLFFEYDLVFVLLGKEYLRALHLPKDLSTQSQAIFLTSKGGKRYIPDCESFHQIQLNNADANRLGAGLIALKGRVVELLGDRVCKKGCESLQEIKEYPNPLECFLKQ